MYRVMLWLVGMAVVGLLAIPTFSWATGLWVVSAWSLAVWVVPAGTTWRSRLGQAIWMVVVTAAVLVLAAAIEFVVLPHVPPLRGALRTTAGTIASLIVALAISLRLFRRAPKRWWYATGVTASTILLAGAAIGSIMLDSQAVGQSPTLLDSVVERVKSEAKVLQRELDQASELDELRARQPRVVTVHHPGRARDFLNAEGKPHHYQLSDGDILLVLRDPTTHRFILHQFHGEDFVHVKVDGNENMGWLSFRLLDENIRAEKQAKEKANAEVAEAAIQVKIPLEERMEQEARKVEKLTAALTNLQEVYARAASWPALQVTSDRSPFYEFIGEWKWEEVPSSTGRPLDDPDQFYGKVILQAAADGKVLKQWRPKLAESCEFRAHMNDAKQPSMWDLGQPIFVNLGLQATQPRCPTPLAPAVQRDKHGTFYFGWVLVCDVRQKPLLPPAPWSMNMMQPGQVEIITGRRAEIIAIHRVFLQPGQVSENLNYLAPLWQPGEKESYTRGLDLRKSEVLTLKTTINGVVEIFPPGKPAHPDPAKRRLITGALQIEVELPGATQPSFVEFVYYRIERSTNP